MLNQKRNHHILPKAYLAGFAEPETNFIWMYRKGRPYKPGRADTAAHNPTRVTLKRASVVVGFYAYPRDDGSIDYNTYENALERIEKPAIPIIRAIGNQLLPSAIEREALANFIYSLHRRVPARFDRKEIGWAEFLRQEETFRMLTSDEFVNSLTEPQRERVVRLTEEYKKGPPRELLLKSMISESELVRLTLTKMTWRFLMAPEDLFYVTSDDPVFTTGLGLTKAGSELTLPLTERITLHASWQHRTRLILGGS